MTKTQIEEMKRECIPSDLSIEELHELCDIALRTFVQSEMAPRLMPGQSIGNPGTLPREAYAGSDDKSQSTPLPWAHPVRADLARGYIVDANDNYVCLLRASRSDEYNQEIAKALNAYAASSATRKSVVEEIIRDLDAEGRASVIAAWGDPAQQPTIRKWLDEWLVRHTYVFQNSQEKK